MLNIELFIQDRYPGFYQRHPKPVRPCYPGTEDAVPGGTGVSSSSSRITPIFHGFDFVEQVLDYFDFRWRTVRDHERRTVFPPTVGSVIIANHPIGSLDGLALLKLVRETRPDVKVVANETAVYHQAAA